MSIRSRFNRKSEKVSMGSEVSSVSVVQDFKFHLVEFDETDNGLWFNDVYLPEEILCEILSYIEPKQLLKLSLVCRKWCGIVKSWPLWAMKYQFHYKHKPERLPWYVFYCLFTTDSFDNLIKNGNGELGYKHWTILNNGGSGFTIESPPVGADPLPVNIPEFHGNTSCFATSCDICTKYQTIDISKNNLLSFIIKKFRPQIYVSEWVAGRFDCACSYQLQLFLVKNAIEAQVVHSEETMHRVRQWEGKQWEKIEVCLKDYPTDFTSLHFQHMGCDNQFWAGHYGPKMAGAVVKLLFNSMKQS